VTATMGLTAYQMLHQIGSQNCHDEFPTV